MNHDPDAFDYEPLGLMPTTADLDDFGQFDLDFEQGGQRRAEPLRYEGGWE